MVLNRIKHDKHVSDAVQPFDSFGFRPIMMGAEHTLIIFEAMAETEKSLEWGLGLWMASLDLRNAFDQIEYE